MGQRNCMQSLNSSLGMRPISKSTAVSRSSRVLNRLPLKFVQPWIKEKVTGCQVWQVGWVRDCPDATVNEMELSDVCSMGGGIVKMKLVLDPWSPPLHGLPKTSKNAHKNFRSHSLVSEILMVYNTSPVKETDQQCFAHCALTPHLLRSWVILS